MAFALRPFQQQQQQQQQLRLQQQQQLLVLLCLENRMHSAANASASKATQE